jgi:hypothetical protein
MRRREREAATAKKLAEREAKTQQRLEELRRQRTAAAAAAAEKEAAAAAAAAAEPKPKPTHPNRPLVPASRDALIISGGGGSTGGGGSSGSSGAEWSEEHYLRRIMERVPRLAWASVAPSQYTAETSKSACTVLSVQAALHLMAVPYSPVRPCPCPCTGVHVALPACAGVLARRPLRNGRWAVSGTL